MPNFIPSKSHTLNSFPDSTFLSSAKSHVCTLEYFIKISPDLLITNAEFCGCLLPFVNAVSTTPILYFLAYSHILVILISSSEILFSYDIGKSYPVIKHSGNKRISAWFSEDSSIAIMIVSIFLSICALMARFCSMATLNIHFPSYR